MFGQQALFFYIIIGPVLWNGGIMIYDIYSFQSSLLQPGFKYVHELVK
jgi:hypothetical protein